MEGRQRIHEELRTKVRKKEVYYASPSAGIIDGLRYKTTFS